MSARSNVLLSTFHAKVGRWILTLACGHTVVRRARYIRIGRKRLRLNPERYVLCSACALTRAMR